MALRFSAVEVGEEAPVLTSALTRADLVQYAGASGDHNPMHTDEVAAREAGFDSVFGHGMFSAGLLATAVTNWVGVGALRRFNVRFVKQTWPGEDLSSRVKLVTKRQLDGEFLVDLECTLANAAGEVKVAGEAVAALPA